MILVTVRIVEVVLSKGPFLTVFFDIANPGTGNIVVSFE